MASAIDKVVSCTLGVAAIACHVCEGRVTESKSTKSKQTQDAMLPCDAFATGIALTPTCLGRYARKLT